MAARALRPKAQYKGYLGSREQLSMDPVEVFCRIRPVTDTTTETCVKAIDDQMLQMTEPVSQENGEVKAIQARFTHLFNTNSTQRDIFDRVALDLCDDVIQGKSALLFTYGITGSGKTYTMTGCPSDVGILPRCLDVIFNSISEYQADHYVFIPDKSNGYDVRSKVLAELDRARLNLCPTANMKSNQQPTHKAKKKTANVWARNHEPLVVPLSKFDEDYAFAVFISYIEIYNNYIYDLLDPPADKTKPPQSRSLREDANRCMYVNGVTEVEVRNTEEAFEVLTRGQKIRRVAHTLLNTESSRSHSVFTIRLVKGPLDESGAEVMQDRNKVHVSQLSLVDLAGSERSNRTGNIGDRLRETGCINSSLMTLRQCLEILRENQKTCTDKIVPYRDSKVTHLFKHYFDGEGKVRMIVCVNPNSNEYDENVNVLKFAELTKDVKVMPSMAMVHNFDGLTPGRRRAAQVVKEVREEMDRMIDMHLDFPTYEILPLLNGNNMDILTVAHLNALDFTTATGELMQFLRNNQHRQQLIGQERTKRIAVFEGMQKLVLESECLKRTHEESKNELNTLRSDNLRLKQKLNAQDFKLRKYEQDAKWLQSQEEILKRREREMAANVRNRDDKLRAVKEVFERPPPLLVKKRAPSPPPKPWRQRQAAPSTHLRHRRSQSTSDLTAASGDENAAVCTTRRADVTGVISAAGVTPYCPGRHMGRRVPNRQTNSSDSSDAPVKRRSDDHRISAVKRGRDH